MFSRCGLPNEPHRHRGRHGTQVLGERLLSVGPVGTGRLGGEHVFNGAFAVARHRLQRRQTLMGSPRQRGHGAKTIQDRPFDPEIRVGPKGDASSRVEASRRLEQPRSSQADQLVDRCVPSHRATHLPRHDVCEIEVRFEPLQDLGGVLGHHQVRTLVRLAPRLPPERTSPSEAETQVVGRYTGGSPVLRPAPARAIVLPGMIRWGRLALASVFLGVGSAAVGMMWRGGVPVLHPEPWLELGPGVRDAYSGAVGLALGALSVLLTRAMVNKWGWAKHLHAELRPIARGITGTGIVVLAVTSAGGEELLFRGLLAPWIGLVPQALIFGLAHQIPGRSRWVWATWASAMGVLLGSIFQLTGSLVGPVVAHALVNGLNLAYLKHHDPRPPPRVLGGLLGQDG